MPDEVGTDTTRSDAPSADDSLFGDAPDDTAAAEPVAEDATQDAPQDGRDAGDSGEEANASDDLKIVVSIKGGRATIGVQRPSADPHIETFEGHDLSGLAEEVPAVTERARARWEETPKHPAYARPTPPAKRRNRRQQGTAQAADAEGETAQEEQQQTLRLF